MFRLLFFLFCALCFVGLLDISVLASRHTASAVKPPVMGRLHTGFDVSVKQLPMITRFSNLHGYVTYRFSVRNHSLSKAHRVRLSFINRVYHGIRIQNLSRSVVVGPGGHSIVSLLQPAINMKTYHLQVVVDGGRTFYVSTRWTHRSFWSRKRAISILLSPTLKAFEYHCRKMLLTYGPKKGRKKSWRRASHNVICIPSLLPVSEWSKQWLSYSRFDSIILQNSELLSMPSDVRLALYQFVASGGTLGVLGAFSAPANWLKAPKVRQDFTRKERSNPSNVGAVGLAWKKPASAGSQPPKTRPVPVQSVSQHAEPVSSVSQHEVYSLGFGQVFVFPHAKKLQSLVVPDWKAFSVSAWDTMSPFQITESTLTANQIFPVVKDLSIPVRGLFLMMLLFSLLIGPINLWVLARRRKRTYLLLTVPLAALLTSALVFLYALISVGWHGHERTSSVSILDQRTKSVVTLGWTGFYMPILPSQGIVLDYNTELTLQMRKSYRTGITSRSLEINWDRGQELSAGWLVPRLPLHFKFRKIEIRRERLVVVPRGKSSVDVTNGLGVAVSNLWLADARGRLFSWKGVLAPGEKKTLSRWESKGSTPISRVSSRTANLRILYRKYWYKSWRSLVNRPEEYLIPGTYIAEVQRSPFVKSHNKIAKHRKYEGAVYGIWKGAKRGN